MKTLNKLPLGCSGKVCSLDFDGKERRRILDLGLTKDTLVESLQASPVGDPVAYLIRGTVIALRNEDAAKVWLY